MGSEAESSASKDIEEINELVDEASSFYEALVQQLHFDEEISRVPLWISSETAMSLTMVDQT